MENQVNKNEQEEKNIKAEEVDYIDKLQRLQAEFVNFKKRTKQQQSDYYDLATGDVLLRLLPVLDDFEHYFSHHNGECQEETTDGFSLIYEKFAKILKDIGLETVQAEKSSFDPTIHEAIKVDDVEEEYDGKVLQVWQKGFTFKGKLLRPAKVIVGEYKEEE